MGEAMGSRSARQSNLELMRILLMLAIVAHHYVVNSGVLSLLPGDYGTKGLFIQMWGMWGKAAINSFVLVTGYFMCTSCLTWVKALKLWLQIKFYRIAIFLIFVITGYEIFTFGGLVRVLFNLAYGVGNGFTASFFVFYLLIPFLNRLLSALDKHALDRLLILLLTVFVGTVTLFNSAAFNEVGWYVALYLLAARIRLYPMKATECPRITALLFIAVVIVSIGSVAVLGPRGIERGDAVYCYRFMVDSSKVLAFLVGLFCFLFFKNLSMPHSRVVNAIASTTFGVLLIHASSDTMRQFLWGDLLNVAGAYGLSFPLLVIHAVGSTVGIFLVCSAIDAMRLRLLERPLFDWVNRHRENIEGRLLRGLK